MEIIELKDIYTKTKNLQDGLNNNTVEMTQDRISGLKYI